VFAAVRRIDAGPMVESNAASRAASECLADLSRNLMARRNSVHKVGVVMGSDSDWEIMQHAVAQLDHFGIAHEARVLSAHRTPDDAFAYAESAVANGFACLIAGAGGAAHLAGVLAAKTTLPVLGVPIPSKYLRGEDSLLSTVQMPKGIPVATFAIGEAGAANAGLFAVAMLARTDDKLARKLDEFRAAQTRKVRAMKLPSGT
jgi:5-(carboxyamino)imidazole ribonucleotide mutase